MRTNKERIEAMHRRAAELKKDKRRSQLRITAAVSAALSILLLVLMAVSMPRYAYAVAPAMEDPAGNSMNASIFAAGGAVGYIVIAFTAFLLGVSVTIFCFRLKKWQDSHDAEDRQ